MNVTDRRLILHLTIHRYSTVAYLDCDLGQPEFTPSGFISLHLVRQPIIGTSFTHLSLAQEGKSSSNKMHYLGSATPKNNPAFYLWAISDLIEYYSTLTDEDGQSIPLVINTQGWYKGLGSDLLLEIHRMARPSIAFDFSDSNASNGYAAYGSSSTAVIDPAGETEVVQIQPYVTPENGPPRINASDLRALQFISYFHMKPTLLSSTSASAQHPTWDFSTSLLARRPYSVHWSTFSSIKLAVSDSVRFADLLRALDASIVALREELAEDVQEEGSLLRSYERGFGQNTSQTLGLGLIRSIDVKAQSFHVITPLPTSTLQRVNAITKGDIEVPTVLMVDHTADTNADDTGVAGVEWKKVPYLQSSESVNAGVGHGRRKVRRNVMRRSQFK
jgi:polynucleotide 5'-hydroxyl-kinase GRC3/NOL9